MLAFMVQSPVNPHAGSVSVLAPLLSLLLAAVGGGVLLGTLQLVSLRARRVLRSRIAKRRQLYAAWGAELRARAMMDELCPYGWNAQITVGQSNDPPEGGSANQGAQVSVEWTAYEADRYRPAVRRRVYAPSINEALDAMVADRCTDETLERIERASLAEGESWPDR